MNPEALAILNVFKERGVRAGGAIGWPDFGEAVVWEAGFVRDEPVREAIGWLTDNGYIDEFNAAAGLTVKGDEYLYPASSPTHGARVFGMGDVVLIKQTVLKGTPPEYVIDEHRERHVAIDDDAAIAAAIRDAVTGVM